MVADENSLILYWKHVKFCLCYFIWNTL